MVKTPLENYIDLMRVIRTRFDSIESISKSGLDEYSKLELVAFHGRKIIEAIAFGCLVAVKNGLKTIPSDSHGQYNAEKIFKRLKFKRIEVLPCPSELRKATKAEQEEHDVKYIIEGSTNRQISKDELIRKYRRMHAWLHELNPYTKVDQEVFYKNNNSQLWKDLHELDLFLSSHFISINGEGFFCILRDKLDGATKVISLSKP